jgi:YD repeat-containing protein
VIAGVDHGRDGEPDRLPLRWERPAGQITDPENNRTLFHYDATGQLDGITRVTNNSNSTGPETSFDNVADSCSGTTGVVGKMVETDAETHATTYCYDNAGQVIKVINANGHTSARSYTANGDVATFTDGNSPAGVTQYDFDPTTNDLNSMSLPAGSGITGAESLWTAGGTTPSPSTEGWWTPCTSAEPTLWAMPDSW